MRDWPKYRVEKRVNPSPYGWLKPSAAKSAPRGACVSTQLHQSQLRLHSSCKSTCFGKFLPMSAFPTEALGSSCLFRSRRLERLNSLDVVNMAMALLPNKGGLFVFCVVKIAREGFADFGQLHLLWRSTRRSLRHALHACKKSRHLCRLQSLSLETGLSYILCPCWPCEAVGEEA